MKKLIKSIKKTGNKDVARTQVCFLLDETSSMEMIRDKTISGFNEYLTSIKEDKGDKVMFTLNLFNTGKDEIRYSQEAIDKVVPLTRKTYIPSGMTPLYDAIGRSINRIEHDVKKSDLVIFVIMTDGEENSSKEYELKDVKALIEKYQSKGWKFLFMGVGLDKYVVDKFTSSVGLPQDTGFSIDSKKIGETYRGISLGTNAIRSANVKYGMKATASMSVLPEEMRDKLSGKK